MFRSKPKPKTPKSLLFTSQVKIFSFCNHYPQNPPYNHLQSHNYVNIYMKWKKDPSYDKIEHIHKSLELKPIILLKNIIALNPNGCIPISQVSKKGLQFDIKIKVARFLRQYPSIFEEFIGPKYNLPWFRLTKEAIEIDKEEKKVLEDCKEDLRERLKKMILMSQDKVLPFKIIQGMLWYLGLPEDFLQHPDKNLDGSFKVVEMADGLKGLSVESGENMIPFLQRNAVRKREYNGEPMESIEFPLFPSKGLRLRTKIRDWFKEFQKLPYVSPYENYSEFDPDSDIAEKRVVAFVHELLSLFVEHSAERKKLLCLKKYFGLPQKFHKVFERHPHIFYLSFKNKTCTSILKEPYCDQMAIDRHPMLSVRNKYIRLIKVSDMNLKRRRVKKPFVDCDSSSGLACVDGEDGIMTS